MQNSKSVIKSKMTKTAGSVVSFYNSVWNEWNDMIYHSPAPRIRRKKVLSWIKNLQINSLLDVGCGNGQFLRETSLAFPHIKMSGADISFAVIETNQKHIPHINFFNLDLINENVPKKFDIVVSMEVIEHCDDYVVAVRKLSEMAGKYLLLTVPCGPIFKIDKTVGHNRHFRNLEITRLLNSVGFKVMKSQEWGFPFFNLYKYLINLFPGKLSEAFLTKKCYGLKEKLIASIVYRSFNLCFPWWGYQLFVLAQRDK
ncbi:MAG: class I SAM-dependent methyltransferase [Candidatus Omnitrophota bacterium]